MQYKFNIVWFISIHAPLCGGRLGFRFRFRFFGLFQSTPPCAGGDLWHCSHLQIQYIISIHAPLCGGRHRIDSALEVSQQFQSTPPCAGGDVFIHFPPPSLCISIHAPLCGGRPDNYPYICLPICDFNPRPPVRGATGAHRNRQLVQQISIHAPLCGGRLLLSSSVLSRLYFNPRPPVRGAT